MTRGQKGCFVFCTDENLANYLRERLQQVDQYRKAREKQLFLIDDREPYN